MTTLTGSLVGAILLVLLLDLGLLLAGVLWHVWAVGIACSNCARRRDR